MMTPRQQAAMAELAALITAPTRPMSDEEQRAEAWAESQAEERAWEGEHGRLSEGEMSRREDSYERWMDGMWGAA